MMKISKTRIQLQHPPIRHNWETSQKSRWDGRGGAKGIIFFVKIGERQITSLGDLVIERLCGAEVGVVVEIESGSLGGREVEIAQTNKIHFGGGCEVEIFLDIAKTPKKRMMVSPPTVRSAKVALNNQHREMRRAMLQRLHAVVEMAKRQRGESSGRRKRRRDGRRSRWKGGVNLGRKRSGVALLEDGGGRDRINKDG
jgi:hypothetical protein